MRRYIVLLLITGIVWAQTDFDILVLKDGTTYFGEYSKPISKESENLHQEIDKLHQQGWVYTKIHRHLLKIDLKLENIFANLCL